MAAAHVLAGYVRTERVGGRVNLLGASVRTERPGGAAHILAVGVRRDVPKSAHVLAGFVVANTPTAPLYVRRGGAWFPASLWRRAGGTWVRVTLAG